MVRLWNAESRRRERSQLFKVTHSAGLRGRLPASRHVACFARERLKKVGKVGWEICFVTRLRSSGTELYYWWRCCNAVEIPLQ